MASYKVHLKHTAEKDLRKLPKDVLARVFQEIEDLGSDPFPAQVVKLSGADRLYRVRVGDYRIIYEVDTREKLVTINNVRHRREVYRPH